MGRLSVLGFLVVRVFRGLVVLMLGFIYYFFGGWIFLISLLFKLEKKKGFFLYSESRDEIKFSGGERV